MFILKITFRTNHIKPWVTRRLKQLEPSDTPAVREKSFEAEKSYLLSVHSAKHLISSHQPTKVINQQPQAILASFKPFSSSRYNTDE